MKVGSCTITAEQVVNGVKKKVTCSILVKQSVTKVTLDPTEASIAMGDYLTINATIEPKINNATLHWVSSNDSIVEITQTGALSATIRGVSGGVAVISAINQDNIVVGSC